MYAHLLQRSPLWQVVTAGPPPHRLDRGAHASLISVLAGVVADLPFQQHSVSHHSVPAGRPCECRLGALRATAPTDDAGGIAPHVLEDVAVVGESVEEPSPHVEARCLPGDHSTGRVD